MHVNRIWEKIEDLIVIQISSDETYVCPCVTGPSAATKNHQLIMALMAQIARLRSNKFRDKNTGMHPLKSVPSQSILTQLYTPVYTCMHVNRIWQKIEDLVVIQISSDETYVCPCVTGPSAAVDTWGSISKAPLLHVRLIPRTKS